VSLGGSPGADDRAEIGEQRSATRLGSAVGQGISMHLQPQRGVYIFGAGGHSAVVAEVLGRLGIPVIGVFADAVPGHPIHSTVHVGLPNRTPPASGESVPPFIVAIGHNRTRLEMVRRIGSGFASVIDPSAIVSPSASIGEGTVVLHAAVIQTSCVIGRHVIINATAMIDHDNVIGDYVHVGPKASLGGQVKIGEGTHVGPGAVVLAGVCIGRWCVIAPGSVVTRDVPDGGQSFNADS
jgi:sugar O-acyltransferase (sialic acid O-acetyltransferase NeuD family)